MIADAKADPEHVGMSPTEARNPGSTYVDVLSTLGVLELINAEDRRVPQAVMAVLPKLAIVVDLTVKAIHADKRVHYFGAGTSGRFGVLDAAEVPPTYGIAADRFQAHIAGGNDAMARAVEEAEDSHELGVDEAVRSVAAGDVVIGLAASGHTPYVAGALETAHRTGAITVAVTANPTASVAGHADHHLCVDTGPEVVTGSTRMKAGTAQKLVLHSLSTAVMIRLGQTYSNLMIEVAPNNTKLKARLVRLLQAASGASTGECAKAIDDSGGNAKVALVVLLTKRATSAASTSLASTGGAVRRAVAHIQTSTRTRRDEAEQARSLGIDLSGDAVSYAALVAGDGEPVVTRRGELPGRRPGGHTGLELPALLDSIGQCLHRMLGHDQAVGAVAIGMTGAPRVAEHEESVMRLVRAATGAKRVVLAHDAIAAYVDALGMTAGAVLAVSNGTTAIGTDLVSTWRQVDGLDQHLSGGFGSGAWIGNAGLQAAACQLSGNGGSSVLAEALVERFGTLAGLIAELHSAPDRVGLLASFAPAVFAAADGGDEVAVDLVRQVGRDLASTLSAAAEGLTEQVAVSGSLITGSALLRAELADTLTHSGLVLTSEHGRVADGAARLAHAFETGQLPEIMRSRLTVCNSPKADHLTFTS